MSSSELFKTKECALTSHVINLKEKEDLGTKQTKTATTTTGTSQNAIGLISKATTL